MHTRGISIIAGCGIAIFVGVVLLLHLAQPGYDPTSQFMSELALGSHGSFLLLAFMGIAIAVAATGFHLHANGSWLLLGFLLVAAICFLAAGVITLAVSSQAHILLVALAFALCGLSMYLLPRVISVFSDFHGHLASWGACLLMCGSTGLGGSFLAVGVAQRISAVALLLWLLFVSWRLAR